MRDAFLKLLNGERPDEVVWTADISYWIDAQCRAGNGCDRWRDEQGHLDFCGELGVMPYFWYGKFAAAEPVYDGVEVATETRGPVRVRTWTTPVGTLREEATFVEASASEAPTRYAVSTEDDLKVLLYVLERRSLRPTNLDDYPARLDHWARHDGVPCLGLPRSPLPALLVEWAGLENATYLLHDCPERVAEALALMADQEEPILDALCELAPPLIHFPDNLTSESLTGLFDSHLADHYRGRLDRLRAAGVRCAVHLDGTVRGLLGKLAAVGFDAVEALTPQPVGDVGLAEMRQVAASESVVLWGGVPGAMFAPPFGWPDMRRHVTDLLAAWSGGPFVVGVADQVPPNGEIEFCRQIADLVGAA